MKKILYLFSLFLILLGCARYSLSAYENKLGDWIGKSAKSLYESWGRPQSTTQIDANTYLLTYFESEETPIDDNYQPYSSEIEYDVMTVPNYGLPVDPPLFYCKTAFVVRNGIVVDFNFNGDDCY